MINSTNRSPFLILQRSKTTEELLQKPDCFALLTQIALRARRSDDFNLHNLKIGESFIGDYQRAGLTEQRYRTAKNNLAKWGFATFKATNKGTIAKLTDSRVYDINEDEINGQDNGQTNSQATDNQRTINEQSTTKKNYKNLINKEIKEEYNILADGLIFVLEAKMNKKLPTGSQKSYAEEIRKLIEIDLKVRAKPEEDVKRAIQAIADNYGKDYFPVIQSGGSFREKFSKIENYKKPKSNLGGFFDE